MIDWQAFHFIRPEWLLAILPLAVLLLLIKRIQIQQSGWQQVLASHLYKHLVSGDHAKHTKAPLWLLALAWLITAVALAGPTWERLPQPVYQLHAGKVVVIDMSLSMRATDVNPDRLSRARFKAIDLVNAIAEGETGLVAYAGDAFTISPLTTDSLNLTTLIPSLSPEIMPVPGSDPYTGLARAIDLLQAAGYQEGDIFWITDGIELRQVKEVVDLLQEAPYRVSVLAVGTANGAPVKLANGELLKDSSGNIVVPKLNESQLSEIAKRGGGRYAPMQSNDSDIEYLTNLSVQNETPNEGQENEDNLGDEWKDMGAYLVVLLLPFAAFAFRRGALLSVVLCMFMLPVSSPVKADWWDDMWKTRDQQGQDAFKGEDYETAAAEFSNPMWQGSSHYKAGNYEAALEAFQRAEGTDALYNTGNALAQLGEIEAAIDAYEQVLAQNPDHQDAAANKALLEQQQEQEQQQQQQNQQNQENSDSSNDSDDSQQSDQNQQSSDQQNSDQQQGSDSQQQDQNAQDGEGEQQENDAQQQDSEMQQDQQDQSESSEQGKGDEEQQEQSATASEEALTDEEKEQMQRMQNLMKKIPDDPAYLLKRKMQLEYQQRRRERLPNQVQRNW